MVLRECDDRPPDFKESRPVLFDREVPIPPDERIDCAEPEALCCSDHRADVLLGDLRLVKVGRQWVGIVPESADRDLVAL